ncbi:hypothetical protein [Seonamhaeicola sp.]|uniref:hypothetical protein n=1 Tax=Seonamhaeicola sp. TaxID=1912245 RepID=UPI003561A5C4
MKNLNELHVQEMDVKDAKNVEGGSIADYLVDSLIDYVVKIIDGLSKVDPQV